MLEFFDADHRRSNLAHFTFFLARDGISTQYNGACSGIDRTCTGDIAGKPDGCVGENASNKFTIVAERGAAAYLPKDTTRFGAVNRSNLTIPRGQECAANLEYVNTFPTQC